MKKERRRKQEELKNLRACFGGEAIIVRKKDVLKKKVAVLEDRHEHVCFLYPRAPTALRRQEHLSDLFPWQKGPNKGHMVDLQYRQGPNIN